MPHCPYCSMSIGAYHWYTLRKEGDFFRIDLVGFGLETIDSISTLIQSEADAQKIADELNRVTHQARA